MIELLSGLPLADFEIFGQKAEGADLAIIALLVLLEGVLSIDNALVLGLLAKRLPPEQRPKALSYGLIGAFVFRVIAICTASLLLQWTIVKFIGGAYLVYIAVKHLFFEAKEDHEEDIIIGKTGEPELVQAGTGKPLTSAEETDEIRERLPIPESAVEALTGDLEPAKRQTKYAGFWGTVAVIELTDVAFAVDSILAAMALAGSRQEKLWVVITGGIIGVVLMRFAAAIFIKLLDRFPRFELSAYLLVVVIGLKLLVDWGFNSDWSFQQQPYFAKLLGSSVTSFENLEASRRETVKSYEGWLEKDWIFHLEPEEHDEASHDTDHDHGDAEEMKEEAEDKAEAAAEEGKVALPPHVPHLLNFHDLRRPECMTFWLIMLACFIYGFVPGKKNPHIKPDMQLH
ncbi:Integral membrane protein TerC [Pirellula staleyi DSM 6068]|uniref:Integral membrane protein TerC n=1 Tax=Pirellula staleyi (strain ATCC 27377 / DSM 6068 / ICPB 4128) TaxID=530564 RepID=D2QXL0_PIRSD|nr:integral membrane protein TerC [Pirellula staleyi]ADB16195.1 Integral membrane protein TerC [Pirellula staleyi DSM 6068]